MGILGVASIWSWSIAFDKIFKFYILKIKTDRFEKLFVSEKSLEDIFTISQRNNNHPFARVFLAAMKEWHINDLVSLTNSTAERKNSLKERISAAMQIASIKSMERLESGMNFLAIIGSSAPFVGLFGTVWGIMNAFQAIAISKNTSLSVVAPGIAESLLATAIGLFAAIPAVLFYNIYNHKINNFLDKINNFSMFILSALSRELDR